MAVAPNHSEFIHNSEQDIFQIVSVMYFESFESLSKIIPSYKSKSTQGRGEDR
jgi:hypothetical protein